MSWLRQAANLHNVFDQCIRRGQYGVRAITSEHTNMKPKNTICLWFDKDAHEAARFYAATFPDSKVTAVHKAPSDYPGGKKGDVLTVEFTVLGIPCLGLNGGPAFKHSEAFSFQIATDNQEETDRYWNAIVGNGGKESAVRLVQGPLGPLLADHAARADRCACGWWR